MDPINIIQAYQLPLPAAPRAAPPDAVPPVAAPELPERRVAF